MANSQRIYLASRSPRRSELLHQVGIAFEILPLRDDLQHDAEVDEMPMAHEEPIAYVLRIARAKAVMGWRQIMAHRLPHHPVLAADTTVVLDDEIIGKPDNAEHARILLRRLSGKAHQVLTAIAVAYADRIETALSTSTVEFRELGNEEIRRYVASGEPLGKAGAYAIQGFASVYVAKIEGNYSNVMGLPMPLVRDFLNRAEVYL